MSTTIPAGSCVRSASRQSCSQHTETTLFLPFTAGRTRALHGSKGFVREARAVSPRTRVIIPRYFKPIVVW